MDKRGIKQQIKGILGAIPVCALLTICLEVGLAFMHRSSSIQKHLIHFAILLLVAWGLVLLYGVVPSVRKLWKQIDQKALSAETRKPWVEYTYAAIAILMLLHHFYVLLYYPTLPSGASRFAPVWIPFAVVTVLMGKMWKDKGFWISAWLAAFLFERTFLKDPNLSGETMVYMVSAIYALIICYGIVSVIQPRHRYGVLKILCALWTIATLIFCTVGLYTAWTGVTLTNLVGEKTYVHAGRLRIFSLSTTSAGIIASGVLFAMIGIVSAKKTITKILYLIACLPMLVTNALTDTRSSMLMLSFVFASMIILAIWGMLKRRCKIYGLKNSILIIGLSLCFIGCFLITLIGQQKLTKTFVNLRNQRGVLVASAQAEENDTIFDSTAPPPIFIDRNIITDNKTTIDRLLSGRKTIWEAVFSYVQNNPDTLFYGLSADGSVKLVTAPEAHCHNILIQILMEGGIPGLILYFSLLIYFVFHTCRLWKRWKMPLWQRALPIPVLAIMLMEMVECLTHFSYGHIPMTVLYFFMGATVAVSRNIREEEKQDKQQEPVLVGG